MPFEFAWLWLSDGVMALACACDWYEGDADGTDEGVDRRPDRLPTPTLLLCPRPVPPFVGCTDPSMKAELLNILVSCGGVAAVKRDATPFSIGTDAVDVYGSEGFSAWNEGECAVADEGAPRWDGGRRVRSLERDRLNSCVWE